MINKILKLYRPSPASKRHVLPYTRKGILLLTVILTSTAVGCSNTAADGSNTAADGSNNSANKTSGDTEHAVESTVTLTKGKYSDEKLDASWDATDAITLTFDNNTISSNEDAAKDDSVQIEQNTATITSSGTYILTGILNDGQIVVDIPEKDSVKLVFNNVTLSSSTSAPVYVKSGNTVITLADNTDNCVSDAADYIYEDIDEDEPNAAIFAKDDLTFNGTGTLTVTGNYNHAIQCKDALKFVSGTYNITSAGDSIVGKDSVSIQNGNYTIESGDDGIKSTNTDETDKGYIIIDNGTFQITAANDGIQAETLLLINDGEFHIQTGEGSANVVQKTDRMGGEHMPNGKAPYDDSKPKRNAPDRGNMSSATDTESSKALKSYVELAVKNGTFSIDSCDDALHSNQNITIDGGIFTITSGDDGIHADASLTINDVSLNILQSYEGLEAFDITINNGELHVTASDDGINAAGDNNSASLTINGGILYVNSEGDGLDANGSILITGGTSVIHGPSGNGDGTLDYVSGCRITGGTLFAAGSSGMIQYPDKSSTQPVIVQTLQHTIEAGTTITVKNSSGTVISEIETEKNIQWYCISSPEFVPGDSYTVCIGDDKTDIVLDSIITEIQ